MQIYPTRSTFHVAMAACGLVILGAAVRLPTVVSFGGAMLLAVAFGRALARMNVGRLRTVGIEMVWAETSRVHRIARGSSVVLRGEISNRGDAPARAVRIRPIASSMLEASVALDVVDLLPGARVIVNVTVRGQRVGRWGLYGLELEANGAPFGAEGLYEVPLRFAAPLGIEVLPANLGTWAISPRRGLSRRSVNAGQRSAFAGRGDELRELRDHVPGDAFRRIAWKASARRGRLLVREMEREERDVVWLIVDSSVELWAGRLGRAPLDGVLDDVAAEAVRHLRRGDRVGLVITASRLRAWLEPAQGLSQAATIARTLAGASSVIDRDRSALDEEEVARLVAEHACFLDSRRREDMPLRKLDALAVRAEALRAKAPFATRLPFADTPREQTLRHYLACFGVETPPRIEGERARTEAMIARVLARLAIERPRGDRVHVWGPAPANVLAMAKPVASLRRRGVDVRWSTPRFNAGLSTEGLDDEGLRRGDVAAVVAQAVEMRANAARERGERALRRLGVRVWASRDATLATAHAPEERA